jgi:hypothetical protein
VVVILVILQNVGRYDLSSSEHKGSLSTRNEQEAAMNRVILSSLVGFTVLLASLALSVEAIEKNAESKPRLKWEYKKLDCESIDFAKVGDEGWEMVTVVAAVNKLNFEFSTDGRNKPKLSESTGASGSIKGSGFCTMYFKRQK